MTAKLTILGCGSSGGVPRLGPNWGACDSGNPKNRRRRASVLIDRFGEGGRTAVLIDASPDLREQLLEAGTGWLDGLVFTHDHADHTHGIDDLRMIAFNGRRKVDVWADRETRASLETRFGYCFHQQPGSSYPAILQAHDLTPLRPLAIAGRGGPVELVTFPQEHGDGVSLGVRIGNVAYSSDASGFPDQSLPLLQDLDVWILGALRHIPHPSHLTVRQALAWVDRIRPKRTILTHLHVDLDYEALRAELPAGVEPAYDGMEIVLAP